ncbi:MAG: hypothetical protein FWE27_00345 [Defluviitaleaceae bacterium]|nr:hypothetical protein [Defluviitaleaceae bacterium]
MMELKVRKAIALLMSFLIVFAIAVNPSFARESNNSENTRRENESLYIPCSENIMQTENLSASDGNVETFNIIGQIALLQSYIHYAHELLADTLVDVHPGTNTAGNRYWSTQEARNDLIAAIAAAQAVLDAHGGGIQPDGLTIIPYSSCYNIPVYEAELELFINNERAIHKTEVGIISIPNIPAGSNIRLNISTPCDTLYQFPRWKVDMGDIEIPPFAESPEFIMPDGGLVIIAEFETIAEYYFDWNVPLEWCGDLANSPIELPIGHNMVMALSTDNTGQSLDITSRNYNAEVELTEWIPNEWHHVSTGEVFECFDDRKNIELPEYPLHTLSIDSESFSVSPQNLNIGPLGGFIPMDLTPGVWWNWDSNVNWLSVSHVVRNPPHMNDSFRIIVEPNTGNTARTGRIRLQFNDSGPNAYIWITQEHGAALQLCSETWRPWSVGESAIFEIYSNRQWTITVDADWLAVYDYYPLNRTGFGVFGVVAIPNLYPQRTGRITVTAGGITHHINVTQNSGPALMAPTGEWTPGAWRDSTSPLNVLSNRAWTAVSSHPAWLTVTPSSHTGDGTIVVSTTTANTGNTARHGKITISIPGIPATEHTIDVIQAAGRGLVLDFDSLTFPAQPNFYDVDVFSDRTWEMPTSDRDWLTVSHVTPSNRNGNGRFRINVEPNLGIGARTGTITVRAGTTTRTVTVRQDPGPVLLLWGVGESAEGNTTSASYFAQVQVTSNRQWTVTSNQPSWLRATVASGNNNASFQVLIDENTTPNQREGTITIASQGIPPRTVRIRQAGRTATLSLSENVWNPPSAGSEGFIRVTSNATWTVSSNNITGFMVDNDEEEITVTSNVSWLRADSFSPANRTGNGGFRIISDTNLQNTPRTGNLFVAAPGAPTQIISVTQDATSPLRLNISEWTPTSSSSNITVQVEALGAWGAISDNTTWLTVTPILGNGNGTLRISARPNSEPVARQGTITVRSSGFTQTITVTQRADPGLRLSFSWNENNDRWFLIEQAVRIAGGSASRNRITDAVTANVYGVTVSFDPRMPGVVDVPGRGVAVRADVFYPRIVNAAGGEIVFLGGHRAFYGHPILFGSLHTYVKMFVSERSNHWGRGYFGDALDLEGNPRENTTRWGLQFATLSGIVPSGGLDIMLIHGNAQYDLRFDNTVLKRHLSSEVGAIDDLLDAKGSQGEGWIYGSVLVPGVLGPHICNNILSGLLHATGLHPGELMDAPGWNQPTPLWFFGR